MPYIGNPIYQSAFVTDQFSGNGSTTAFTMSVAPAGVSNVLVAVSGVLQDPSTYGVAGNTITFSTAPPSGTGNISCRYLGVPVTGIVTTAYRTVTEFTATASQTTFTPPSYTVGFINVYLNGVLLGSADYTATNGTTVVLATGASAGNLVTVESFRVETVLNAISNSAGSVSSSNLAAGSVVLSSSTVTGVLPVANGGTGSSTFPIYTATYLVIGGGGGASNGGGGAGGFITGTCPLVKGYTYTVTVGAGGAGVGYASTGNNGNVSWFEGAGAYAGGGGGGGDSAVPQPVARSGASGGGGGGTGSAFISVAGAGTAGQGFQGGTNNTSGWNPGGGGGGAGSIGGNAASSSQGGQGGVGLASSITGSSVFYAGGGGGANAAPGGTGGAGGNGGGGAGASGTGAGTSGTANTGGGGGGMGGNTGNGGNGGSGIVILRILTANYTGTTTGSPTVTTSGSNTIISFTSSGTYTA